MRELADLVELSPDPDADSVVEVPMLFVEIFVSHKNWNIFRFSTPVLIP
jgi:hypothetical protein